MDLAAEAEASAAVAEADSEEDTEVASEVPIIMDLIIMDPEARISAADGSIVHITDEDITATEAVASADLWVCFSCPSSLSFSH